jgi:hypothetical protein
MIQITCAKCGKPIGRYCIEEHPASDTRRLTVFCHGESEHMDMSFDEIDDILAGRVMLLQASAFHDEGKLLK